MIKPIALNGPEDVVLLVNKAGFVPFFAGDMEDFSLQELTPARYWFPEEGEGVWDWKNAIIAMGDCAYGKFYRGKACYISMQYYPDFINVRRSQHALTDEEQRLLDMLTHEESLRSDEWRRLAGYTNPVLRGEKMIETMMRQGTRKQRNVSLKPQQRKGRSQFDSLVARLEMSGRVLSATFEYKVDRHGHSYGWGIARYCTPETFFGGDRLTVNDTPEHSRQRLVKQIRHLCPNATADQVAGFVDY
jgi:hypothetical protein